MICYAFGLFEGDGYKGKRTIGLTNRDKEILQKFAEVLKRHLRVKPRFLEDKRGVYRVIFTGDDYRKVSMAFNDIRKRIFSALKEELSMYFAGRFDADGSFWKGRRRCKITYGKDEYEDIARDIMLLSKLGIYARLYKNRSSFDLTFSREHFRKFIFMISRYSVKVARRAVKLVP